jgi:hypothetical protein
MSSCKQDRDLFREIDICKQQLDRPSTSITCLSFDKLQCIQPKTFVFLFLLQIVPADYADSNTIFSRICKASNNAIIAAVGLQLLGLRRSRNVRFTRSADRRFSAAVAYVIGLSDL